MPAITIQSLELTDEQKQILADKYITIFSEITNVPKDRVYLFFDGYTFDNVACDGLQFSKRPPRSNLICKHYQDLEKEQKGG